MTLANPSAPPSLHVLVRREDVDVSRLQGRVVVVIDVLFATSTIVHALAAVAMLLVVIVHIYAGFYVRGTISAMTEGKVTGGWAYRHHRLWLRQEAREGVIDERQTPPRRHSPGPAE